MGIPYYFKKVSSNFPSTLSPSNNGGCNRLFLDFNCAIHYCSNQLKKELGSAINDDFEKLLIARVLTYIDFMVSEANPSELVYLSMDGLAPRAKMSQQRNRRYISAYVKSRIAEEMHSSSSAFDWDSNAISPGTSFMTALSAAITIHASTMSVHLINSDTTEVGEGEHKIMNYIKAHGVCNDIIYGLDADLIMLALINQGNGSIRLMREPVFYDERSAAACSAPFVYLDVKALGDLVRTHIATLYDICDKPGVDAIAIYVFLCFFLGNDFVPHLTYIKLKDDGLETLLAIYKKTVDDLDGMHILHYTDNAVNGSRRYTIQYSVLWKLLELLSTSEDEAFNAVHEKYIKQFIPKNNGGPDACTVPAQIEARLQLWPCTPNGKLQGHAYRINPHEKGWRLNYYHYLFASMSDVVTDACHNYIQGLVWLVDCYFHHSPHRGWYYKHVYSPTMLDLFNYLTCEGGKLNDVAIKASYNNSIYNNGIVQPHEYDLQLLCILPPSSMHLIKQEFRSLYTDITKGCVHMFPRQFGFHSYLKRFLWECHPLIPVPNIVRLRGQAPANPY